MNRTELHKQKANWGKRILISLITLLLVIIAVGVAALTPQGNTVLRGVLSDDTETPLDLVVRSTVIKKLDELPEADSADGQTLAAIKRIAETTTTPEVVRATESPEAAVSLLKDKMNMNDDTANAVVEVVFADEATSDIRNDIQGSNWLSAYKKLNELRDSGKLQELKNKIQEKNETDIESLQDEASKILNSQE